MPLPLRAAEQVVVAEACTIRAAQVTATPVTWAGAIERVVEEDLEALPANVAVMTTFWLVDPKLAAVYTPVASILPRLADQVTAEPSLADAEQVVFSPEVSVVLLHVTGPTLRAGVWTFVL